jgi:hypothetical protein
MAIQRGWESMESLRDEDLIKKALFVQSCAESLKPGEKVIILYIRGKQGF